MTATTTQTPSRLPVIHIIADVLPTLLSAVLFTIALHANWTRMITSSYRWLALGCVAVVAISWLIYRTARGWQWYRTALDGAIWLCVFSFSVSLAANLDVWRRIIMGLWFAGLYTLLWFILHDWLANSRKNSPELGGGLARVDRLRALVDGLLLAGLPVLYRGYMDYWLWLHRTGGAERPNSILDNPNPLATVLLILIPLAVVRLLAVDTTGRGRRLFQAFLAVYALLASGLLYLTATRGAWVGAGGGAAILFLLLWMHYGHRIDWRIMVILVSVALIGIVGVTFTRGWNVDGRDILYGTALRLFGEKPITGSGLFTFGRGLLRLVGMIPNTTTHSQAHDLPLNVAAELGIIGLAAFAYTGFAIFRAVRRNWRDSVLQDGSRAERFLIIGGAVALVAVGIHHLFDVTAVLPAVAIAVLVPFVVAAAPSQPVQVQRPIYQRVRTGLLTLLAAALLVAGAYDNYTYNQYLNAINYLIQSCRTTTCDDTGTAQQLEAVIAADPQIPLYRLILVYVEDRLQQFDRAQAEFDQFCAIEPYYVRPPWDGQIAILHYFRLSLATGQGMWTRYHCPGRPSF